MKISNNHRLEAIAEIQTKLSYTVLCSNTQLLTLMTFATKPNVKTKLIKQKNQNSRLSFHSIQGCAPMVKLLALLFVCLYFVWDISVYNFVCVLQNTASKFATFQNEVLK